MEIKKKYHGGLKVLLLPLFIMLLGMLSTCYAYVSQEYVDYALDTLLQNGNWISDGGYSHETGMKAGLNKLKENNVLLKTKINEMLDYYSIPKIDDDNVIFLMLDAGTGIWLRVVVSNCSYPGSYELGYLRIGTGQFSSYDPDNPSNNTDYIYGLQCAASSSGISDWGNFSLTGNNTAQWSANRNGYNWNQELSVITFTNLVACKIPSVYTYYPMTNLATATANLRPALITGTGGNYIPPTPEPTPTPQPQLVGTITNPSGDITGTVNLQPIEQGITNIQNQISGDSQRIIENQNQNTQTIVNTISGEVGKINNTLTNVPDISNTIITSGDIERCFRV